jgi:hypothetical protein
LDLVVPRGEEGAADANATCDSATSLAERIQTAVARAKLCLQAAQQQQQAYADMHRRELQFAVGDEVLLSTKNIKVKTAAVPSAWRLHSLIQSADTLADVGISDLNCQRTHQDS